MMLGKSRSEHRRYNGEMHGASRITVVAGAILVATAWIAGSFGLPGGYHAVTKMLAEVVAALVVVLAWRYGRDRLAIAAAVVGGANLMVRTGLAAAGEGNAGASLALFVSLDLGLVALTRDRPLWRPRWLIWLTVLGLQAWFAGWGIHTMDDASVGWLAAPNLPLAALAGCALVTVAAFLVRRSAFEGSLIWVVIACLAALLSHRGPDPATLLFAAAELTLLVGLFEDSYRLAFHDELTGLPGRRALNEAMRGLGGVFTIAMVDIDHFKKFNDRHGHDAGDQVLRMVADHLAGTDGGRAYRYGGEEFTIVFPGKDVAEVREDLDLLRASLADRKFALRGPDRPKTRPDKPKKKAGPAKRVTVTVSIGTASSSSRRRSPASVLTAADNALYRAKRSGRNRVVAAGDRLTRGK
jgi:diguanylate cyclase (GGDEF)-like protein